MVPALLVTATGNKEVNYVSLPMVIRAVVTLNVTEHGGVLF